MPSKCHSKIDIGLSSLEVIDFKIFIFCCSLYVLFILENYRNVLRYENNMVVKKALVCVPSSSTVF